jgi:hypothetical protein
VEPRFSRLDVRTYQTPDYDGAIDKVDIKLTSGAGNVTVNAKLLLRTARQPGALSVRQPSYTAGTSSRGFS